MITRIEIDGFKTFRNFTMDFSPLTLIAGTNASGKSNLFDALHLLSRMAETDLKTAFSEQRGDASELFTQYTEEMIASKMSFLVEILVGKKVRDNWGGEIDLKYTRLRYEVIIHRGTNDRGLEDLYIANEKLENLKHEDDEWIKLYINKKNRENWRPKVPKGRRGVPYIFTEERNGILTIVAPQDGRTGIKREFPARNISQSILSGFNSIDFPHILAAKEELISWKFLQLNPENLRSPSPYLAKDSITQSGQNLAAALQRIKLSDKMALKDISRKLNNLLPNIIEVDVFDDKASKQFIIKVKNEDGREFSSRVLSEGTLRLLTLCIFQYDDLHNSVLCFEEPENGIHPARMKDVSILLKGLSVDFTEPNTPLRQIIVNTHSPVLVGEVFNTVNESKEAAVWLSQLVTQIVTIEGKRYKLNVTKIIPVESDTTIGKDGNASINFPEAEKKLVFQQLLRYLQNVDFEKTIKSLVENE